MWVGSERSTLCASANEELGTLADNTPLTKITVQILLERQKEQMLADFKQRFKNTSSKPILIGEVSRNWVELSSLSEEKLITPMAVMNNFDEINNFFMNNHWNKIGVFVKYMRKVLMRWKNWSDFKGLHSIQFQWEDWSKIDYPWTHRQDSGTTEWSLLYEWFERFPRCWISTQWTISRDQSTSVFPTSSRSWWNAKPFSGNAEPQQWAAEYFGTCMVYRETFLQIQRRLFQHLIRKSRTHSVVSEHTSPHMMSASQTPVQEQRCQSGPSARNSFGPSEGGFSKNYEQTTTTAGFRSSFWQIPHASNVRLLEDKIQDWGMYLFTISYGSYAVDQRSWVGWFSGWYQIFMLCQRISNAEFWCTRCEDRFSTEPNHPWYPLQEKSQSGGTKRHKREPLSPRKTDRLLDLRVLPGYWSQRILSRTMPTYLLLVFEMTIFRNSIRKWDEILLSMTQIPSDDILEGSYKLRRRESEKLKTVLELYDLEIHQKKGGPDYHILKTMVKRSIEQNLRIKNFEARNGKDKRNAVVKNQVTKKQAWTKNSWSLSGNGKLTGSVQKETFAVSVTISTSVQNRHSWILLRDLLRGRMREMHREPEVREARVRVEECLDCPARITSKELAPIHSVKSGILLNACSTSPRKDADLEKSALLRIARLKNSLARAHESLHRFYRRAQTHGNRPDV